MILLAVGIDVFALYIFSKSLKFSSYIFWYLLTRLFIFIVVRLFLCYILIVEDEYCGYYFNYNTYPRFNDFGLSYCNYLLFSLTLICGDLVKFLFDFSLLLDLSR